MAAMTNGVGGGADGVEACLKRIEAAERSLAAAREGLAAAATAGSAAATDAAAPAAPPTAVAEAVQKPTNHVATRYGDVTSRFLESCLTVQDKITRGVRSSNIQGFLRKELTEAQAIFELPVVTCLFVFFTLAVLQHGSLEAIHAVDKAISFDITENANFAFSGIIPFENGRMGHKSLGDVNSFADIWSWLSLGAVPIFWPSGWDVSEARANVAAACTRPGDAIADFGWKNAFHPSNITTNAQITGTCPEGSDPPTKPADFFGTPETPTYLFYNSILGGMRIRQERTDDIDCPAASMDAELASSAHKGACVPDNGYWLRPELHSALGMYEEQVNKPEAKNQYLLSGQSQTEIRAQLRKLENDAWINPRTAKVEMLYTTYNAHLDLFTCTFILLFMNRGGHFHKLLEPVSIWLHPYSSAWNYVWDICWLLLVVYLAVDEGIQIAKHIKQLGFRRGLKTYFSFVNVVDWVNVIYSFVIVIYWIFYLGQLDELNSYIRTASVEVEGTWKDAAVREAFFGAAHNAVQTFHTFRFMLAIYPFVLVLRFFKAFSMQPRLAVVTETLRAACVDILHFGFVFFTVFFIYVISAMILFGQEMEEYAEIGRATTTTFRVLMGDFDWEEMNAVGRPQAAAWFWSLMILLNLIMLNMLLAIIMDVYSEVKGNIGCDAPTLVSQVVKMINEFREIRAGRMVPTAKVLKILDPTDLDDGDDEGEDIVLTADELMKMVPGLSSAQAESILAGGIQFKEDEERGSALSQSEISLAVQIIHQQVHDLYEKVMPSYVPGGGVTKNGTELSVEI
eukprot:TRINITY_DN63535_c0_g1_i1.p1 TRINITY_DN63535_c0_g1~~TRINITY_DN63535_c0_g1_i1.p1  ORF type:complete len:795 (-),score=124.47 TRINITY_DN63535_c0_g1_i1:297-2681(-)